MDTRKLPGAQTPLPPGTPHPFQVQQLAQSICKYDLTGATAYSLNVTLVPASAKPIQYATLWPTGVEGPPNASLMNSPDGRIKANAVIAKAGDGGQISFYVTEPADVILDLNGYFTPAAVNTMAFYPIDPCRLVDTRSGLGGEAFTPGETRDISLTASPCMQTGKQVAAKAYSLNITVVPVTPGQPLSYLSVWPAGNQAGTATSTLNNPKGTIVANAAIVPAGPKGDIYVHVTNATDVLIDVNGYFAPPSTTGMSYYPMYPCRVLDTRSSTGPFSENLTVDLIWQHCPTLEGARAYTLNATAVPVGALSYLTMWQDDPADRPLTSTLNAPDALTTSNMAIVPTTNGYIDVYAAGTTDLVLDMFGYFAR